MVWLCEGRAVELVGSASISMRGMESSLAMRLLPVLAHRDREARDALDDVRDALREVDRRRPFLSHGEGDLDDLLALAVRTDDELAREDVAVQLAAARCLEQRVAPEGLEPVRVRAVEVAGQSQEAIVHPG